MTQYFPYGVKLSQGQMQKLSRAYNIRSSVTLRLNKSDLKGNNELMLTKTQINKIQKAIKMNKGVEIKISKTQIRKVIKHGGALWSSLAGLALPLAKKIAGPLASGALSGLASVGVNKLFGSKGSGFLIPDSKVNQLIQYKNLLTEKQKRDILNALQTGSGVHIKPTQKQMGNGIGTILASIGIPMLLDAIMGKGIGKGLQVDSNRSRRSVPIKLPPKNGGLVFPYRSPPFYGTWDKKGMMGMGRGKKKKRSRVVNGSSRSKSGYGIQQKRLVKNPSVRSTNIKLQAFIDKPLSNFDLINWVNQLGIKYFRGVFSRDDLPDRINEPEVGIINLDSKIGPGTHWVCYRNDEEGGDLCEYFDPFGLIMPTEVLKYLQTSGEKIIYSTDEIQERDSVLCGYWCLYYLLERQKGRSILHILHNSEFDPNDKSKFIIKYFKNLNI